MESKDNVLDDEESGPKFVAKKNTLYRKQNNSHDPYQGEKISTVQPEKKKRIMLNADSSNEREKSQGSKNADPHNYNRGINA